MRIDRVNVHNICLPFTGDFSHSPKKGSSASNIVVEVIDVEGNIKGFGEGAPRPFVTEESQESATNTVTHFLQNDCFPWELNDVSQVWDFIDRVPSGKGHNAAICALEMSLLDALGKGQKKPIIEFFPKDFYASRVYYGASIPLGNKERITEICKLIKKIGIKHLRIKLGINFEKNREALGIVKRIFEDNRDLRIDLNGAWNRDLALKHVPLIRAYKVKVVEQPMMPNDLDIADLAKILQDCGVVLMADESACSLRDIEQIISEGYYKMINVRLSKCGGLRNSLRMLERIRKGGLSFQIGCQLGESGILSAAGRVLSLLCRDALYHDGSYDRFILKENTTFEDVSFGPNGKAGPLEGPGLGVRVSRERLLRLSGGCPTVTISNPLK